MINLAQDLKPISYVKAHTTNAINLAKLLSFGEKDIKNGNLISHETAKEIFERTLLINKKIESQS